MWLIARHHSDESIRIEAGMRAIKGLSDDEIIQVVCDEELPFQVRLAAVKHITADLVNREDHRKLELVLKLSNDEMIRQTVKNGLRDLALIDGYFLMQDGFVASGRFEEEQFDSIVRLSSMVLNHPEIAYKNAATRLLMEFCREKSGCQNKEIADFLIVLAEDERFPVELRESFGTSAVRFYIEEGGKNRELLRVGNNHKIPEKTRIMALETKNHEEADMNHLRNIDYMLDSEQLKPEEAGFMYIEFSRRDGTTEKGIAESLKRFGGLRPWVRERAMKDFEQEAAAMRIIRESTVQNDDVSSMVDILSDYVRCCVGRNKNIGKFLRALQDSRMPENLREKAIEIARRTAVSAAERYGLGVLGKQEPLKLPTGRPEKSILKRIRPVGHA